MIRKAAKNIGQFLVDHGLPTDNLDVYAYGAECMLSVLICYSILLIWSLLYGYLPEMILWISGFTFLRNQIGGYHANTHWQCTIESVLLGITSIFTRKIWLLNFFVTIIVLFVCLVFVFRTAPVTHPNHPLTADSILAAKNKSRLIVILEILLSIILFSLNVSYCSAFISGIIMAVLLSAIGSLQV